MEKFKLSEKAENGLIHTSKEVDAERIMIKDLECFIFIDPEETNQGMVEGWNVSHLETGMRIASDLSREMAIKKAISGYEKSPNSIENARKFLSENGIALPVNK